MEFPTQDPLLQEVFELLHRLTVCETIEPVHVIAMQAKSLIARYVDAHEQARTEGI